MKMNNILNGKFQEKADKAVKSPIYFTKPGEKYSPVYMVEDHPNDDRRFAILRTTENGKYVRGEYLYFNLNGFEIYTDINDAIFVDLNAKTVFIKSYKKVVEEIQPADPEHRQYIIMMTRYEDGEEITTWESMIGRQTIYNYIVNHIEDDEIDPQKSFVLVETVPYSEALTVEQFIKYLQNAELVDPEEFDIEEYIYE